MTTQRTTDGNATNAYLAVFTWASNNSYSPSWKETLVHETCNSLPDNLWDPVTGIDGFRCFKNVFEILVHLLH